MNLHPVAVMVAILAGGELLGVAGALLAIPVTAAASVVADEVQRERLAHHQGPADGRARAVARQP